MWGKGIYFAENARYSDDYFHEHGKKDGNKVKGMFFALVNLGRVADLQND